MGFTNDVTVAVWLGYDNADGKRRTLGGGATGGGVAVPIFEPIIQAVWANVAPKTALAPPSPEAKRQLTCKSIDLESGEVAGRGKALTECLRVDAKGKIVDTQYLLVSRGSTSPKRDPEVSQPKKQERAISSDDSVRNSYWSRDPGQGGPQSNWQREYRQQHPE